MLYNFIKSYIYNKNFNKTTLFVLFVLNERLYTMNKITTQVLVVGAGASGIPAAIAAARIGAKVILVEEDYQIGGAPVDNYVCMFCGDPMSGILKECEDLLKEKYAITSTPKFYLPSSFEKAFTQKIINEPNITLFTGAKATKVVMDNNKVIGVIINDSLEIRSSITIDATGCAAIAGMAGNNLMYGTEAESDFNEHVAPKERNNNVQQCTWMYFSQQIDCNAKPLDMMLLDRKSVMTNEINWYHEDPNKGMQLKPQLFLHWGCAVECQDTRCPIAIGQAQRAAMKKMQHDHDLLREFGYTIYMAPKLGIREITRANCDHIMTLNDIISGKLPDDTIAVGTYGIDSWGAKKEMLEVKVEGYGVPYRSLIPNNLDNLLVVGRAIGGTHIAMSSYRVMPIAGSIGQAGGVAAALCALNNTKVRNLDHKLLRKELAGPGQNAILDLDFA